MRKPTYKATRVFRLHDYESEKDVIRLNPNLMGAGGLSRNQLIAIINGDTGAKTYAFGAGAGEDYKLYPKTIALNYDARLRLGVNTKETFNLKLRPANFVEQEIFYLKHQHSLPARRSHSYSIQGWLLGVLGFFTGLVSLIPVFFG